jgi:hypothetical protein
LPDGDTLRSYDEIVHIGDRYDAIKASAEAQVHRDLERYLPEALKPFPGR